MVKKIPCRNTRKEQLFSFIFHPAFPLRAISCDFFGAVNSGPSKIRSPLFREGERGLFWAYLGSGRDAKRLVPYVRVYHNEGGEREPEGTVAPALAVSVSYATEGVDIFPVPQERIMRIFIFGVLLELTANFSIKQSVL